jgi:hypothetical protein
LRTLPRLLSRLHWFVNPTSIVSSSDVFYNKLKFVYSDLTIPTC